MNEIIIKKEDFHKDTVFKPVLNFNFSTHILFKCTKRKYANNIINGRLKFNKPSVWIKEEIKGNKGQGDSLEGVFLATNVDDNSKFIQSLKQNENIDFFVKNNLLYFRNKIVKGLYCFCLYGLNSNMFTNKEISNYGKEHYFAKVEKEYFSDFSNKVSEEEYFKIDQNDRPAVLFINNPSLFFNKIRNFFIDLDIPKEDIIISPVEYVNFKKPFVSFVPSPYELLLKDEYFSNQSEVRIIINSKSKKLLDYMAKNDNIINIGNLEDIITIYDYYFHDLLIEKNGNEIYFTLPFPEIIEFNELPLKELLYHYIKVANNEVSYEITINERKQILDDLKSTIKTKYGIDLRIVDGQIHLLNFSGNIKDLLDK